MKNDLVVCPACKNSLHHEAHRLICSVCSISYPVLASGMPVLVAEPDVFVAQAFLQYEKYLSERRAELVKLQSVVKNGFDRTNDRTARLENAYRTNDALLKEIADALRPHISVDQITEISVKEKTGAQAYMVNFIYLLRDWGRQEEGEAEIRSITDHVLHMLDAHGVGEKEADSILFLGAGMGRLACEVAACRAAAVYAADNSITMGYLFDKLLREDIRFFEINLKNTEKAADVTVEHLASAGAMNTAGLPEMHYFVGDASRLPFPDHSISAVVSAFFTDVLPLPMLIKEVKRVLRPGGVFLHFGPLEYHHDDVRFMFSLEEVKELFSGQQFEVHDYESLILPHCRVLQTGMYKTYRCWSFAATKTRPFGSIQDSTTISLGREVDFFQNGTISHQVYETHASLVLGINDVYEGAETVIDILNIVRHRKTFQEMISALSVEYGQIEEEQQEHIKRILIDLANKGVLHLEESN